MRSCDVQIVLLSAKDEAPAIDHLSYFIMQQVCQTMKSSAKIRQSCAILLREVSQIF